ncbi:MAG: prohibitin family protein [Oscillospiraceae bacterium]|nr:prohibitin family protein [Oscillospiraceae bacterium]
MPVNTNPNFNGFNGAAANARAGARKAGKALPLIILAIVAVILLSNCFTTIPTGHTGVVTTFGSVEDYTFDAGVHFKLPWQRVVMMDNRIQKQTVSLSCFSSDIQEVSMIYTVNYQIKKANAQEIYKSIGTDYYNTVIIPCITESTKVVTAKYSAENLVGQRAALASAIEVELAEKLDMFNVELVSTSIDDMDFTDAFTTAVEEKQVAQQNKLRAQTEAEKAKIEAEAAAQVQRIQAQAEADATLIRAEAEAAANQKIAESLTEQVLTNKYIDAWDGKMPMVTGGGAGNLISVPLEELTD